MKISRGMVEHYLNGVTSIVSDLGCLPETVTDYQDAIMDMKLLAQHHGDLNYFRLAVDRLLLDPTVDVPSFAAIHFHFDQNEMHELLLYIRALLWPDLPTPNPEEIADIQFEDTSSSSWWARNQSNQQ